MKRLELINDYSKLLHIKNYSPQTEKAYLHHLNLFLDYVKTAHIVVDTHKVSNLPDRQAGVDSRFLLDYFNYLKQSKNFSYSAMKQALAAVRFLYLDVLKKEIDFDFFLK